MDTAEQPKETVKYPGASAPSSSGGHPASSSLQGEKPTVKTVGVSGIPCKVTIDNDAGILSQNMQDNPVSDNLEQIRLALCRLVKAVEGEDELLENSAEVWNAYEYSRKVLGDPVKILSGGHVHHFGWIEADGCDICDEQYVARAEAGFEVGG